MPFNPLGVILDRAIHSAFSGKDIANKREFELKLIDFFICYNRKKVNYLNLNYNSSVLKS
jgi:hypothetical protein